MIAVRKEDKDSQKIKDLLDVLETQKTVDFINDTYDGVVLSVFDVE
ncbi:MetQ/NlpA family ABC transporter substrate-binding protein [uncultured Faecalicoccus sp.]|nr:MetQ/NlpA family ABC transporter substrate-binding protein [uncultured Faecalicoccus sp.]